jgi:hypothetical protein
MKVVNFLSHDPCSLILNIFTHNPSIYIKVYQIKKLNKLKDWYHVQGAS